MLRHPTDTARPQRPLDPIDRFSEILFGLIMVLTFTGSISAAESGREAIRTMLFAAIGCNLAWGIVDAVMYLFAAMAERGRGILALRAVRDASDPATAHQVIRDALPPVVASALHEPELEAMRQRLNQLHDPSKQSLLTRKDFRGALAVFLLVFLSTFPVVIPFLFMSDATRALRISNAIAIVLLFITGYSLGRYMGHRPWTLGFAMVLIGVALVGMTIALGG
jgi:hypothetical protein